MTEIGEESAWFVLLAGKEMLDEQGITEQLWLRRLHMLQEMAGIFPPWESFPAGLSAMEKVQKSFGFRLSSSYLDSPAEVGEAVIRGSVSSAGYVNDLNSRGLRVDSVAAGGLLAQLLGVSPLMAALAASERVAGELTGDTAQGLKLAGKAVKWLKMVGVSSMSVGSSFLSMEVSSLPLLSSSVVSSSSVISSSSISSSSSSISSSSLSSYIPSSSLSPSSIPPSPSPSPLLPPSPHILASLSLLFHTIDSSPHPSLLLPLRLAASHFAPHHFAPTRSLLRLLSPALSLPANLATETNLPLAPREAHTLVDTILHTHSLPRESLSLAETHQMQLTFLSLLLAFPRDDDLPPDRFIESALQRFLQNPRDLPATVMTLAAFPPTRSRQLLNEFWKQASPAGILQTAQIAAYLARISRDSSFFAEAFSRQLRATWEMKLPVLDESHLLAALPAELQRNSLQELVLLCRMISPRGASLLIETASPAELGELVEKLATWLKKEVFVETCWAGISHLEGTRHKSCLLLASALKRAGEMEAERLENILRILIEHSLTTVDFHRLVDSPLTEIPTFITEYTFPSFFRLFSLLGVSLDAVLVAILRRRAEDEIPAGWSVAGECLAGIGGSLAGAEVALALSRRYAFPRDHRCHVIPCDACADAIAAGKRANELCVAAMREQVGGNEENGGNYGNGGKVHKDDIPPNNGKRRKGGENGRENDDTSSWRESENTLHLEQLASCSRAIRIHLSGLFLRSHFSRLSCHPIIAMKLPPDCFTACEANFSRLPDFLADLYLECVIPAGKLLTEIYPLLTSNRSSRLSRHPVDMRLSVKRNSLQSMVETVETNQPFHFIETPLPVDQAIDQWEKTTEEDFPPTFLFARDGIGGLFCHSVFYEICSNCGVSYSGLLDHVIWNLSEMKRPTEMAGICEEARWKTTQIETISALCFCWEALVDANFPLFQRSIYRTVFSCLQKNAPFSLPQKACLLESSSRVLSHLPPLLTEIFQKSVTRQSDTFSPDFLHRQALAATIRFDCQKRSIPVGDDVLAQVANPEFLPAVLRSDASRDTIWWGKWLLETLSIRDETPWRELQKQARKVEFDEVVLAAILAGNQVVGSLDELFPRVLSDEKLADLGLQVLERIPAGMLSKRWLHVENPKSPGIAALMVEVGDFAALAQMAQKQPQFVLEGIGANVLEGMTRAKKGSFSELWKVVSIAFRTEIATNPARLVSSPIRAVMEQWVLKKENEASFVKWIEFLVVSRKLEEAQALIDRSRFAGDSLREFVCNVVRKGTKADDLLCFLGDDA